MATKLKEDLKQDVATTFEQSHNNIKCMLKNTIRQAWRIGYKRAVDVESC